MSFLGKEYSFERQENFEEFVNALGLNAEQAQGFINYRPTQKLTQDGDSYTLTTTTPQTKNELTFKSGVAFDEKISDRSCKTTVTVSGNTVTQEQLFDDGSSVKIVKEFSDNDMVVTLTSNKSSAAAKRYYKA